MPPKVAGGEASWSRLFELIELRMDPNRSRPRDPNRRLLWIEKQEPAALGPDEKDTLHETITIEDRKESRFPQPAISELNPSIGEAASRNHD